MPWNVLWRVRNNTAFCIHVPEDRTAYYVRRKGWHVLLCDDEFPVAPVEWPPMNVQQNPKRFIDPSEES